MPLQLWQQKALAIAPKIGGSLSMLGSGCIIRSILSERSKGTNTYQRILLAMSSFDFMTSFWFFMSTWPIPRGTPGVWNPAGNTGTCTLQGFFTQFGIGTPCYNASLGVYYLLICRYRWSEEKTRKAEPMLLGIPFLLAAGTTIAGLFLKLYNNANLWCWIAAFPAGCKDSFTYGKEEANCTRGDNAWIYRWAFFFCLVWASMIIATVSMIIVYIEVLTREREVDKMQHDGSMLRKQSKRVAWQSFWYILAFYATWVPPTIVRLLQTIPPTRGKIFFPLILTHSCLVSMQGFLNFIVYSRARFYKHKRENPGAKRAESLLVAAFSIQPKVWDSSNAENLVEASQKSGKVEEIPCSQVAPL